MQFHHRIGVVEETEETITGSQEKIWSTYQSRPLGVEPIEDGPWQRFLAHKVRVDEMGILALDDAQGITPGGCAPRALGRNS